MQYDSKFRFTNYFSPIIGDKCSSWAQSVMASMVSIILQKVLQFIYVYIFFCVFIIFSGQKKLGKVITPDPWKSGARNTTGTCEFCYFSEIMRGGRVPGDPHILRHTGSDDVPL